LLYSIDQACCYVRLIWQCNLYSKTDHRGSSWFDYWSDISSEKTSGYCYGSHGCLFVVCFSVFLLSFYLYWWSFVWFGITQAAKEFESELKTEPEESVAESSQVATSNKEEEKKTEVSSSSKENVWRWETSVFAFPCSYNNFMSWRV